MSQTSKRRAEEESKRNRRMRYSAEVQLAARSWDEGNGRRTLELLKNHEPAQGEDDLRGWEWAYLRGLLQRTEEHPLVRHESKYRRIVCAALSPDGTLLATGGADSNAYLWRVKDGRLLHTLTGHKSWVRSVTFSPDGETLFTGSSDCTTRIWGVKDGQPRKVLEGKVKVRPVAPSPDGRVIAIGYEGGSVRLIDTKTWQEIARLETGLSCVWVLQYSPDGKHLVAGDGTEEIGIWEAEPRRLVKKLKSNHEQAKLRFVPHLLDGGVNLFMFHFSPDGKTLLVWRMKSSQPVSLLDITTGNEQSTLRDSQQVHLLAFSPDGKTIAATGPDARIRLWDVATGTRKPDLGGHDNATWGIAISPDGRQLASGAADNVVKVWDIKTGSLVETFRGHSQVVGGMLFTPDGRTIISKSDDSTMRIYHLGPAGRRRDVFKAHASKVTGMVFCDQKTLATAGLDGVVKLWDIESESEIHAEQTRLGGIRSLAASASGRRLILGGANGTALVWDVAKRKVITSLHVSEAPINCTASCSYGNMLALMCGDGISSGPVDLDHMSENGAARFRSLMYRGEPGGLGGGPASVAFSTDGKHVAAGFVHGMIFLWDAEATEARRVFLENFVWQQENSIVAFSLNGESLFSGSSDGMIRVWDSQSGQEQGLLKGHASWVTCLALSPNGKMLASGSMDRSVRLWDVGNLEERLTLKGHSACVTSIAYSPNGDVLASGGEDGVVRLWRATAQNNTGVRGR